MDLPVLKPERGIGSGKGRNAVFVFGREQRAGDIDKATESLPALPVAAGGSLRLSPSTAGTDGFFIAILRCGAGA